MNLYRKSVLCLFFATMLLLLTSLCAVARERVALVIGNGAYQRDVLLNPVNDAKIVAKTLTGLGFDVILLTDLRKDKMEDAIALFGEKLKKDRESVFYYSGHGVQNEKKSYLIPVDAMHRLSVPSDISDYCIPLDLVVHRMVSREGSDTNINIVMVDACRNNLLDGLFKSSDMEHGWASLSRKADGVIISYATAPGKRALTGIGDKYSPYAKRLVELMVKPNVPVEMMFKELRAQVKADTKGDQVPWLEASLEGNFYFNPQVSLATVPFATLPQVPPNFVLIKGGEFTMGSPSSEAERYSDESPQHQVRLSDFYMAKHEVTVAEFRKYIEESGELTEAEKAKDARTWRHGVNGQLRPQSEENHPVIHVSWNDADAYCKWLSKKTGKTYRLPTEAEWEYACRAGTTTPFNTGNNLTTDQANYNGNYLYNKNLKGQYRTNTVAVESFAPNAWGLYNMHGNVWEWCSDWFGAYGSGAVTNPTGTATGSYRVLRGGSWNHDAEYCRSANRCTLTPGFRSNPVGFRLVFVP